MPESESTQERLTRLESVVSHLQHDVEQMHAVILAQQAEIDSLRRMLQGIEGRLDQASEEPERRDPLDERPPHY